MACTGSIFAAMDAGIMPDRIPKMIHRVMERRIFPQERKILNFNRFESTKVRGNTKINLIAFFSPIILVLSLTETNMILATPKPPTSKAKKAIKQPPRLILVKRITAPGGALYKNGIALEFINPRAHIVFQAVGGCLDGDDAEYANGDAKQGQEGPDFVV
jgi:hypothetical protein